MIVVNSCVIEHRRSEDEQMDSCHASYLLLLNVHIRSDLIVSLSVVVLFQKGYQMFDRCCQPIVDDLGSRQVVQGKRLGKHKHVIGFRKVVQGCSRLVVQGCSRLFKASCSRLFKVVQG